MTTGSDITRGRLIGKLQAEDDVAKLHRLRAAFKRLAREADRTLLFEGAPAQLKELRKLMESDEIKGFYGEYACTQTARTVKNSALTRKK